MWARHCNSDFLFLFLHNKRETRPAPCSLQAAGSCASPIPSQTQHTATDTNSHKPKVSSTRLDVFLSQQTSIPLDNSGSPRPSTQHTATDTNTHKPIVSSTRLDVFLSEQTAIPFDNSGSPRPSTQPPTHRHKHSQA